MGETMPNQNNSSCDNHALWQFIREDIREGNNNLFASSKQGGFLAAALIAAAGLWSSPHPSGMLTRTAIGLFVASIVCSILTHFVYGVICLRQASKNIRGMPLRDQYWIKPAWVFGFLQALLLVSGIICATMVCLSASCSETNTLSSKDPPPLVFDEAGHYGYHTPRIIDEP